MIFFLLTLIAFLSSSHATCIESVEKQFNKIAITADAQNIFTSKFISFPSYSYSVFNRFGYDNHFQGIKKFSENKIFMSGANGSNSTGKIFRINSKKEIINSLSVEHQDLWHPGGLGGVGNILLVPLEDYRKDISKLFFYDISDNFEIKKIDIEVDRPGKDAGAADIFRRGDNRYVVVAFNQESLDFYLSYSTNIRDGLMEDPVTWNLKDLEGPEGRLFKGSSVHFLPQCDGKIFLMNFSNDGKIPPLLNGRDIARIYELKLTESSAKVTYLAKKEFECDSSCNFSAAAGSYISPEGDLSIISNNHFKKPFAPITYFKEFK